MGHRITSPRSGLRSTVSVKALMETYLAKKRASTAASRMPPAPPKLPSSMLSVISRPRPTATGLAPFPRSWGPRSSGMRRTTGWDSTDSRLSSWRDAGEVVEGT